MMRLLGLKEDEVVDFRNEMRQGIRTRMPGAVRASAGINTSEDDVGRLISAVARALQVVSKSPVTYIQDPRSGDFATRTYRDSVRWFGETPAARPSASGPSQGARSFVTWPSRRLTRRATSDRLDERICSSHMIIPYGV